MKESREKINQNPFQFTQKFSIRAATLGAALFTISSLLYFPPKDATQHLTTFINCFLGGTLFSLTMGWHEYLKKASYRTEWEFTFRALGCGLLFLASMSFLYFPFNTIFEYIALCATCGFTGLAIALAACWENHAKDTPHQSERLFALRASTFGLLLFVILSFILIPMEGLFQPFESFLLSSGAGLIFASTKWGYGTLKTIHCRAQWLFTFRAIGFSLALSASALLLLFPLKHLFQYLELLTICSIGGLAFALLMWWPKDE